MGECKNCHGPDGIKPAPENHAAFTSDICTNCHQPPQTGGEPEATSTPEGDESDSESEGESEGPPAIPHELAGRDNCLMCHDPDRRHEASARRSCRTNGRPVPDVPQAAAMKPPGQ